MAALYIPAAQSAAGAPAQSGELGLNLLLPETYEQYLELENPSDFAVNDDYIAIADAPAGGNAASIFSTGMTRPRDTAYMSTAPLPPSPPCSFTRAARKRTCILFPAARAPSSTISVSPRRLKASPPSRRAYPASLS